MTITIEEAGTQFARLLEKLNPGENIEILRDGQPVAQVHSVAPKANAALPPRVPGMDKGKFVVPPEFFDPLPDDILDDFYNGEIFPCKP